MSENGIGFSIDNGTVFALLIPTLSSFVIAASVYAVMKRFRSSSSGMSVDWKDDYYTARGRFTGLTIGLSFFASSMGSWVLFAVPDATATVGWYGLIGYSSSSVAVMIILMFLGVEVRSRMKEYASDGYTPNEGFALTDWVLARYGHVMQYITAVACLFYMWCLMTAEYTAFGYLISLLCAIPPWIPNLLLCASTVLCTLIAGVAASVVTDVIQGFCIIILTAVAIIMISAQVNILSDDWRSVANLDSSNIVAGGSLFLSIVNAELLNMISWQRVWAAKNSKHLRLGLLLAAVLTFVVTLAFGLIGMLAAAEDRGRPQPLLENRSLSFFVLLRSLPTAGVITAILLTIFFTTSTVDSAQVAVMTMAASELLKFRKSSKWAPIVLVPLNVSALLATMLNVSVLDLYLIADLVLTTVCPSLMLGLDPSMTPLGALLGVIASNLSVMIFGWCHFGTFLGGFEMYLIPGEFYSVQTVLLFLTAMSVGAFVTLVASLIQRSYYLSTVGLLGGGSFTERLVSAHVQHSQYRSPCSI